MDLSKLENINFPATVDLDIVENKKINLLLIKSFKNKRFSTKDRLLFFIWNNSIEKGLDYLLYNAYPVK